MEFINQSAIADAVFSSGSIYFDLPYSAEVTLFLFPVSELERPSVEKAFFGLSVFGLSSPHKTFCMFQQSFSTGVCYFTSFNSWHD